MSRELQFLLVIIICFYYNVAKADTQLSPCEMFGGEGIGTFCQEDKSEPWWSNNSSSKTNEYGLKIIPNPIAESEDWIADPLNNDVTLLENYYSDKLSEEHPLKFDEIWRAFAILTGGYPQIEYDDGRYYIHFALPPVHLGVQNQSDYFLRTFKMTATAGVGLLPLIEKYLRLNDDNFSFEGYSRGNPKLFSGRSRFYVFYKGTKIKNSEININWRLGHDNAWYIHSVNFVVPENLNSQTYDENNFSSNDNSSSFSEVIKAKFTYGDETKFTKLLDEGFFYCDNLRCHLANEFVVHLKGSTYNSQKVKEMCPFGSNFKDDEDVEIKAIFSLKSEIVNCTHKAVFDGFASTGYIDVNIPIPYSSSLVSMDAWYGEIRDAAGNPVHPIDKYGYTDGVTENTTVMFVPDTYQPHQESHGWPKRTVYVVPDSGDEPTGTWAFPTFNSGTSFNRLYSLSDAGMDVYDRARVMAHSWCEWLIQLDLDTIDDIKGGVDANGEPNYNLELQMSANQNSHVPVENHFWSIMYNANEISPTSGGNGDNLGVGTIIHEFQHTLHNIWDNNIVDRTSTNCGLHYAIGELNDSNAETLAAILTKGENWSGGNYLSFVDVVAYPFFPGGNGTEGGTLEQQECTRMGRLLDATAYQMTVLSYQIGWKALLFSGYHVESTFLNKGITGWAETGTLQDAFPSFLTPTTTATETTFLALFQTSAKNMGIFEVTPIINNHFNRTATLTYETPNHDMDEIGNRAKWASGLMWWHNSYSNNYYIFKKPYSNDTSGLDLSLSKGSGDTEDYDYFSFFAHTDLAYNLTMTASSSANAAYKIQVLDENLNCLAGYNCTIPQSSCSSDMACILSWIPSNSQLYYLKIWNANDTSNEGNPTYHLNMWRASSGDWEGDDAISAEPTYLEGSSYLIGYKDGSTDEDWFKIVVPGKAFSIHAHTCDESSSTPGLDIDLYSSTYSNGKLVAGTLLHTTDGYGYGGCNAVHPYLTYQPVGGADAAVYFLKLKHRSGAGNNSGYYRLHVDVKDYTKTNEIVDEDEVWQIPLEKVQSNSTGYFQNLRGYLSASTNTDATNFCRPHHPQAANPPAECADSADFYKVYLYGGQHLTVSSNGGVAVSIWAINMINDARDPFNDWSQCDDSAGVGCVPLVEDNAHAIDDNTSSGEIMFVAPVPDYYEIRVVNNGNTAVNYSLLIHRHPYDIDTTPYLDFPPYYTR